MALKFDTNLEKGLKLKVTKFWGLIPTFAESFLPPILNSVNSWFKFSFTSHNYETSFVTKGHLKIPTVSTRTYGEGAFISMTTRTWNNIQTQIKDPRINHFTANKLKCFLFDFYLILHQTCGFIASCGKQVRKTIGFGCFFEFYFCSLLSCNDSKGFLVVWLSIYLLKTVSVFIF